MRKEQRGERGAKTSSDEGQGGRKGLEESRKLESRKLVTLIAGVVGEKVTWET